MLLPVPGDEEVKARVPTVQIPCLKLNREPMVSTAAPEPIPAWTPAEELVITDPAAVEILWHMDKRQHLKPFLGQSADLAGAAAQLGVGKTAMSYWIGRLNDAGLIRLTQVEKRGRHRVSHYRCVADKLRVSLAEAPLSSYEGLFTDFAQRWQAQALTAMAKSLAKQAPNLELCIANTGTAAGLFTTILPRPGRPMPPDDFIHYWARLWLTDDEANALHRELNELYDRYAALTDKTRKTVPVLMHLVHVREQQR